MISVLSERMLRLQSLLRDVRKAVDALISLLGLTFVQASAALLRISLRRDFRLGWSPSTFRNACFFLVTAIAGCSRIQPFHN